MIQFTLKFDLTYRNVLGYRHSHIKIWMFNSIYSFSKLCTWIQSIEPIKELKYYNKTTLEFKHSLILYYKKLDILFILILDNQSVERTCLEGRNVTGKDTFYMDFGCIRLTGTPVVVYWRLKSGYEAFFSRQQLHRYQPLLWTQNGFSAAKVLRRLACGAGREEGGRRREEGMQFRRFFEITWFYTIAFNHEGGLNCKI